MTITETDLEYGSKAAHRAYVMGLYETVEFLYPIWYGPKGVRSFNETYRRLFNK